MTRLHPAVSPVSLFALLLIFSFSSLRAELRLPHFFSDYAVLQQEIGAPVWGWAKAGTEIKVTFRDQTLTTKADKTGAWEVVLQELKASYEPAELTIVAGNHTKKFHQILVGEVWLASGQSNMEWKVAHSDGGKIEMAQADDPLLRVFTSTNIAWKKPRLNWWGKWVVTKPGETKNFPAVAYYYGKRLRAELGVPVGIIECAWGGRPIEAFISDEGMKALPQAKGLINRKTLAIKNYDPKAAKKQFELSKKEWEKKMTVWRGQKKTRKPRGPYKPVDPAEDPRFHSTIFNGMVSPLAGYGMRGVIWYQGEANADFKSSPIYQELLEGLVKDWRKQWQRDFSFYWVQLASYKAPCPHPGKNTPWVTVQDEQRRALSTIPKSGMAVIHDIGTATDIHPRNKKEVGERLARLALVGDYGRDAKNSRGPLYAGMKVEGDKIEVSFDYSDGLQAQDGKSLARFAIAGADGKWHWADAKINGEKVVVWNSSVPSPIHVRYAWAMNPEGANLTNSSGLPASCFTSEPALVTQGSAKGKNVAKSR